MDELNEALLWLAKRQGRVSFSVDLHDRRKDLDPPAPVVRVEAMTVTVEEAEAGVACDADAAYARIDAGNVAGALLAAIHALRRRRE
jgi:hypothetical protein